MQFHSETAEAFVKSGKLGGFWSFTGWGSPCGITRSGSRLTSNCENGGYALDPSQILSIPYCSNEAVKSMAFWIYYSNCLLPKFM